MTAKISIYQQGFHPLLTIKTENNYVKDVRKKDVIGLFLFQTVLWLNKRTSYIYLCSRSS